MDRPYVRDNVAIRERVGYVAQDRRHYARMTARETLRFAARSSYTGHKRSTEELGGETLALVLNHPARVPLAEPDQKVWSHTDHFLTVWGDANPPYDRCARPAAGITVEAEHTKEAST